MLVVLEYKFYLLFSTHSNKHNDFEQSIYVRILHRVCCHIESEIISGSACRGVCRGLQTPRCHQRVGSVLSHCPGPVRQDVC